MRFGGKGSDGRFAGAVRTFEAAVRAGSHEVPAAFDVLLAAFRDAPDAVLRDCGPRLAALLPLLGQGPDSTVAAMVATCVERGADPAACAAPVLERARQGFEMAGTLAERWIADGRGALPGPDGEGLRNADYDTYGYGPIVAWRALPSFEAATLTLLRHAAVRRALGADRDAHLAAVAGFGGRFRRLAHAFAVLDDEPVLAVHRPTGARFALRASGLGDNFQLHTLLAHALIGGGHLPGRAPSRTAVACCRNRDGAAPFTEVFTFSGADGARVGNRDRLADVPLRDGARYLVLDDVPRPRTWQARRLLPGITGDLVLEGVRERVLPPEG
ncbi:hypothetical protein KV205_03125 [Streptomyces sp. SKN60]|uniref:hypothetical protein n=1 Tax=Streptomyces sp. SKN60 TaxID=2855506 RepID=UPI0022451636|nr:hypothetical protein [Streptomyces sp. SKN60]MCX2179526.1 hypothetical protein [Streptomyces sp. SKN60]